MKRNKFSLSNYKLLSCDMGELVPIGLTEVLPGDTFQQSTSALIRVSPLLAPVMHPVHVKIHHWFVPHRLVWEDWENFITGGPDGMDDSELPTINSGEDGFAIGSLADYLGCPTGTGNLEVSALPFRGYNLIWNEWYRDQDLQTPLAVSKESGSDLISNTTLQNIAWEKDYFTSARPWTQKGPEITIPLGVSAPVVSTNTNIELKTTLGGDRALYIGSGSVDVTVGGSGGIAPVDRLAFGSNTGLETDLTSASAANINDLREAFALQRYEEARARYGSRYTEYLRYLGVKSSDARLQRPEYLGGGKQTIQFSEVLQTAPGSEEDDPVGDMKGHGIAALRSNRYRRFFEEHGYVFTFISVKPKTIYSQGLPRTWNRRTKEDFFQKELQHIGQQGIEKQELYANIGSSNRTEIWGYQDRYDEYRRSESTIAGQFRNTLDYWHMARIFATEPVLNADFIKAVPTKRVNAVQSEDVLWIMANHSIQARRMVADTGTSYIF